VGNSGKRSFWLHILVAAGPYDIRRTYNARLWCYPPLVPRLCQCRAGNRYTSNNRDEQETHWQAPRESADILLPG
jgi:hypothetical protein